MKQKKREWAFTDHVPEGMEPCPSCCVKSSLGVSPGFFRDFHVDLGNDRFGVCYRCGGTGCEINLTEFERDLIIRYQSPRWEAQYALQKKKVELAFFQACIDGPLALKKRVTTVVKKLRQPHTLWPKNNLYRAIAQLTHIWDGMDSKSTDFAIYFHNEVVNVCRCEKAIDTRCPCQQFAEMLETRYLPRLCTAMHGMQLSDDGKLKARPEKADTDPTGILAIIRDRLSEEIKTYEAILAAEWTWKELALLAIVGSCWKRAGKNDGCYAAALMGKFQKVMPLPKASVEQTFKKQGTVLRIDHYTHPDDALLKYDEPKKLVIIKTTIATFMMHVRDALHIAIRQRVIDSVLRRNNISDMSDVNELDWTELQRIRDDIEKEYKENIQ